MDSYRIIIYLKSIRLRCNRCGNLKRSGYFGETCDRCGKVDRFKWPDLVPNIKMGYIYG
jgi:phage FluMu protein Com